MSYDQRMELRKRARKGGKELRNKHRLHEKRVMEDIQEHMKGKPKSKKKTVVKEKIHDSDLERGEIELRLFD